MMCICYNKLLYSRKEIESLIENTEKLIEKLKLIDDSTSIMHYNGYEVFRNCGCTGGVDLIAISKTVELKLIDVKSYRGKKGFKTRLYI